MNINDFPKAKEIILNYLIKDIKEKNNKTEYKLFNEDDEETIKPIAEMFLENILKSSIRTLFDVFDENGIFITIKYNNGISHLKETGFEYYINKEYINENNLYFVHNTRKEAEEAAVWEAIKLLEERENSRCEECNGINVHKMSCSKNK